MAGSFFRTFGAFSGLTTLLLTIPFGVCFGFLLFFRFDGCQSGGFGHRAHKAGYEARAAVKKTLTFLLSGPVCFWAVGKYALNPNFYGKPIASYPCPSYLLFRARCAERSEGLGTKRHPQEWVRQFSSV